VEPFDPDPPLVDDLKRALDSYVAGITPLPTPGRSQPCSRLLRRATERFAEPGARRYFKPLRQVIESVNQSLKGQLDFERHGGRTIDGVTVRILQRILALTAAVWQTRHRPARQTITGRPRPLTDPLE
jgi:hypothetical protein